MEQIVNIDVEVKNFKTLFEGQKDSVFFEFLLKQGKKQWTVEKRYSDLRQLYEQLMINHPNLPDFPRKTFFALKKFEDLDLRRKELDYFFKQIFQRQDMYKDGIFLTFFEINQKINIKSQEYIKLILHIENQALGFRDFCFDQEDSIFIGLLGDMSSISRVDSYVTNNLRFPWEKKTEDLIFSVGLLEYYIIDKNSQNKFFKKFNISFSTQVICCDYNKILKIFAAGQDSGEIGLYRATDFSPFYEVINNQKIHGGRVMNIKIDGIRKCIYSIGEDGLLQVIDISNFSVIGSVRVTNGKLCDMIYIRSEKKCFISDRYGSIHIYDNIPTVPQKVQQITTESSGSLRALTFDFDNNILFTCCYEDGRIYGYEIGSNLKNFSNPVQCLNILGDYYCRQIIYISSSNQIAIGYSNGMVVFYNLKNPSNPFYSRKIHNDEITAMKYYQDVDQLISSSKDQNIKFFEILSSQQNTSKKQKKFHDEQEPNNDIITFEKPQKQQDEKQQVQKQIPKQKIEQESSSEEDLADWNDQFNLKNFIKKNLQFHAKNINFSLNE